LLEKIDGKNENKSFIGKIRINIKIVFINGNNNLRKQRKIN